MLEVEKRSLLENEKGFDRVKAYLDKKGYFLGKKILKSFLFLSPTHLRIRLVKGYNRVIITEKIGEFSDFAREENEKEIPFNQLSKFIKKILEKGYEECAEFNTERYPYEYGGLKVELNKIDLLGLIVEVEGLTNDEDQIPEIDVKIKKIMQELGIKELDPQAYKKMINNAYKKNLKKISEHSFQI